MIIFPLSSKPADLGFPLSVNPATCFDRKSGGQVLWETVVGAV